ncbi:MAG: hypothetical protein M2R45_04091 [Verrucomicrobia subdivision 3 bacterium]|nr:hypothetical protein [Limisphaerales bacterium]MCS1417030.1 hypothetical protein [Limisphaerales bacterium]
MRLRRILFAHVDLVCEQQDSRNATSVGVDALNVRRGHELSTTPEAEPQAHLLTRAGRSKSEALGKHSVLPPVLSA